jgi:hypothetical protein
VAYSVEFVGESVNGFSKAMFTNNIGNCIHMRQRAVLMKMNKNKKKTTTKSSIKNCFSFLFFFFFFIRCYIAPHKHRHCGVISSQSHVHQHCQKSHDTKHCDFKGKKRKY